jgi:hypothetical protein
VFDLWKSQESKMPGEDEKMEAQNAIGILRNDPQMRAYFINKIAPLSLTKCSIAG